MASGGGVRREDWVMACPRDSSRLVKVQTDRVTFDRCESCQGLWFDAKELRIVAEDKEFEKAAAHVPPLPQISTFGCPRCAGDCFRSFVGEVETDTCSDCRGVWLDAGELEAAKRGLGEAAASRPRGLRGFLARL